MGMGTALGRRLSRVREAGDTGKLFTREDSGDRAQEALLCPSLECFQPSQDNALSRGLTSWLSMLWAGVQTGDLLRS